jgi:hypothetical protein
MGRNQYHGFDALFLTREQYVVSISRYRLQF